MKQGKEHWNAYRTYEKWFLVIGLAFLAAMVISVVLYALRVFGVINAAFDFLWLSFLLCVVGCGCSAIGQWRRDRKMAIIMLAVAIVPAIRVLSMI